jgi:predicted nucleotidyltransferase
MDKRELLRRAKATLQPAFGKRLRGVILYGSEARGTADPDSDIDLLVLLEGPLDYWPESHACVRALYPLVLELGRPIHARPVAVADYEAGEWPLYESVKKEGLVG